MTSPSLWSRLKNAHLFRVVVIYLGASWLVLEVVGLFLVAPSGAWAQQVGDVEFEPEVTDAVFPFGKGPRVLVDAAHNNLHTVEGRYRAFAELLRRDGYVVEGLDAPLSPEALRGADILVISNAVADANILEDDWTLPTPSAFSPDEIVAVRTWIEEGGSLLLIADHMPWPGAAADLAETFGLMFGNGFARDGTLQSGRMTFRRDDDSLADHAIIRGRMPEEAVESVMAFSGQAFRIRPGTAGQPLLVLGDDTVLLLPVKAWEFSEKTPRISASGMLQGATVRFGDGRVAAFGEAAMFTAQVSGTERRPSGMNHPEARENAQFVLNVLHWLSGLLEQQE